jgi:hypothetical protein
VGQKGNCVNTKQKQLSTFHPIQTLIEQKQSKTHYGIVHHKHQPYNLSVHTCEKERGGGGGPMKFMWLRLPVQHVHPMLLAVLRENVNYQVRFRS